jgi:cellobiose phosphorylase
MNDFGGFDDEKRIYVKKDMYTKRPLINFLWNERYITSFNQFGCGGKGGWYTDESGVITKLVKPTESRLIYIRDDENNESWAANRNFQRENFDEFYTEVGLGYSRIVSKYKNIAVSLKVFVPTEGLMECWEVEVSNTGSKERNISFYAYADMEVCISGHHAYIHGGYDGELNGIFISHHGYNLDTNYTNLYFASDKKPFAFETTNRRFAGTYGSVRQPDALKNDILSSLDTTFDTDAVAALQFKLCLKAGEKKKIKFLLGLSQSLDEARKIKSSMLSEEAFATEFAKIEQESEKYINKLYIDTPDTEINSLANIWLKRQIALGKTWGRVYCRGFRDIMQDVTGFVALDAKSAGDKIKYCLKYQYESGNTKRQWNTGGAKEDEMHPYRDGASWLVPALSAYLKETGKFDLLEEKVAYYESDVEETVYEHCKRGVDFLLSELGEHGLCLWGGGDWNDSLNGAGMNFIGESVWLSMATVNSTVEFAGINDRMGKSYEAAEYRKHAEILKKNILKHGWDKDHFIYGINDWGEKIGAYESEEAKIYLNPQAYAVLAGIIDEVNSEKLLDLVERDLGCPYGYVQLKPSYTKGSERIGRISYFEPGCYENGSVYNHGVTFKIAADCKMGRGDAAFKSIKKMLATNPENPTINSAVEPYVVTNMYLGPENKERAGESLMSWITGTAGWLLRCITEFIIGIQSDYEGLRISPCLPSNWKNIHVIREYRGAVYEFNIHNPDGLEKGKVSISLDGNMVEGNLVPCCDDTGRHKVEVNISR